MAKMGKQNQMLDKTQSNRITIWCAMKILLTHKITRSIFVPFAVAAMLFFQDLVQDSNNSRL